MVDNKLKVVAIIQVRLGSERLPMKALLPLPFHNGLPLLEHVYNRANMCSRVDTVVIATTDTAVDDPIEEFCKTRNIAYFRGSADNVLRRFQQCAALHRADIAVRLTGDNPFIQPSTIEEAIRKHLENNVDYSITEGLPLGTNIEVITASALEIADKAATDPTDREHVTPYIRRNDQFTNQTISIDSEIADLRLTVDYATDYALAALLYEKLYRPDTIFELADVAALVREFPWLQSVNAHNHQKKVFNSESDELKEAVCILKKEGFTRILDRLT